MMKEPIAIIGMACRFPQANSVDQFWQLLCQGQNAIGCLPSDRWQDASWSLIGSETASCNQVKGGFLSDVKGFDHLFFGISQREAATMDPQHRLLLEVAWEALEYAGMNPKSLQGSRTGVFVGVTSNDYSLLIDKDQSAINAYAGLGNSTSLAANRISYFLDFKGPSIAIDAACASSLVSLHLACQSLQLGESDLALTGGVNLILSPAVNISFTKARMLSPDGYCKSFDESADGYVRSEGCGLVVLKRLSDARRDGDVVLAKIRGSAVNQDGRSGGITVPEKTAQIAAIRYALEQADITPGDIGFFEAHGTGTPVGDSVEIEALFEFLNEMSERPSYRVPVGSVKSNIGHLEAAAGVASLIKTVLALHYGVIPPNLHFKKLNPKVAHVAERIEIPTHASEWSDASRRMAGISSFGFGGTNCHVVIERGDTIATSSNDSLSVPALLVLNAQTPRALRQLAQRYALFLHDQPTVRLTDFCHTTRVGRASMTHRLAVWGTSRRQLEDALFSFAAAEPTLAVVHGQYSLSRPVKIAFLVGEIDRTVWQSIVLNPLRDDPTFQSWLQHLAQVAANANGSELTSDALDHPQPDQLAQYVITCAAAATWRSWGVNPACIIAAPGGEVSAAVLAGVLSPEDGMELIKAIVVGNEAGVAEAAARLHHASPRFPLIFPEGLNPTRDRNFDWISFWNRVIQQRHLNFPDPTWATDYGAELGIDLSLSPKGTIAAAHPIPVVSAFGNPEVMIKSFATLFVRGVDLVWHKIEWLRGQQMTGLPTYPFQRKPIWFNLARRLREADTMPTTDQQQSHLAPSGHELLRMATQPEPGTWHLQIGIEQLPYVAQHTAAGAVVVPGVVLLELVAAASQHRFGAIPVSIQNVSYANVLILPQVGECLIRLRLHERITGASQFEIESCSKDSKIWSLNVAGLLTWAVASLSDPDAP